MTAVAKFVVATCFSTSDGSNLDGYVGEAVQAAIVRTCVTTEAAADGSTRRRAGKRGSLLPRPRTFRRPLPRLPPNASCDIAPLSGDHEKHLA